MQMARYRVYLSDVSYFSGKLEAALRAKRIAYERVPITPSILLDEVLPHTGWMKVPALRREDGLWLSDTTPLLRWLDAEHPQRPLLPTDPYRAFLSSLIEDYCDEWQWRPAMFWRWAWADNARYVGSRLGAELSKGTPHPAWAMALYFRRRQQRIYLRGDGVTTDNFDAISQQYPQALGWLEHLLQGRRYLLGDRPSLVDIAWFGPMFRHYAQDPRPAAVMAAQAPRVWAWVARLWNSATEEWDDTALDDFSDAGWNGLFADLGSAYLPYLRDNAAAVAAVAVGHVLALGLGRQCALCRLTPRRRTVKGHAPSRMGDGAVFPAPPAAHLFARRRCHHRQLRRDFATVSASAGLAGTLAAGSPVSAR